SLPMVRNAGGSGSGAAMASVSSRTSGSGSGGGGGSGAGWSKLDNIASMLSWLMAAGSAGDGFGGGGGGFGGANPGFGVAGAAAASSGSGLAASSSAMMRRMEARISSIDGSCAFAGWFMAASSSPPLAPLSLRRESRPQRSREFDSDYRRSKGEGKQQPVDR